MSWGSTVPLKYMPGQTSLSIGWEGEVAFSRLQRRKILETTLLKRTSNETHKCNLPLKNIHIFSEIWMTVVSLPFRLGYFSWAPNCPILSNKEQLKLFLWRLSYSWRGQIYLWIYKNPPQTQLFILHVITYFRCLFMYVCLFTYYLGYVFIYFHCWVSDDFWCFLT